MKNENRVSLLNIAKVFLIIGSIGFGGGMAIIALIQDYCVNRLHWLEKDEFSHGIALGQILGPFAVNSAIFVGYRLRGLKGAAVAVLFFLIPSVTMVIIISALYVRFHHLPSLKAALYGIDPVVVALILTAAYQMGKNKVRSLEPVMLIILTIGLSLFLKIQLVFILLIAVVYGFLKIKFANTGGDNESN